MIENIFLSIICISKYRLGLICRKFSHHPSTLNAETQKIQMSELKNWHKIVKNHRTNFGIQFKCSKIEFPANTSETLSLKNFHFLTFIF